ncbi:pfs domain-containing protein [Colletotrichum higginsianum]|nr:pfs domain-containing protein [Colletotrichum higginsianum]
MWHAALESVDENIEILRDEMAKSPRKTSSHWNFLLEAGSENGETEDEEDLSVAEADCTDEDGTQYLPSDEESGEENGEA